MFWKLPTQFLPLWMKKCCQDGQWISFTVFFLLTSLFSLSYGFLSGSSGVTAQSPQIQPTLITQTIENLLQQGNRLTVNGRQFSIPWIQWGQGGIPRIGISDTGAMQSLGLDLLSTNQPNNQPVSWFSGQPITVSAQFLAPYRYLDLTEVLQRAGATVQATGDTLSIDSPDSEILNIREGKQAWGKRVVVELTRPTFWQVSQNPTEGVIMLKSTIQAPLLQQFSAIAPRQATNKPTDEDDLGSGGTGNASFRVENSGINSKITFSLPTAHKLQVSSLDNPARLVIDIRPDAPAAKNIAWTEGIRWQQQFIPLGNHTFPVTWLTVDLKSPKISLKPIRFNPNGLQGTGSVAAMANAWQASAAINGGFFNRNTQLPLGAIRQDDNWLSGPILNRGAIAWDNNGKIKVGRLSLQESFTTATGQRFTIPYLNSGYVQKGLARYTTAWGNSYLPLTDNEVITTVQRDRVTFQQFGGKAGQSAFPIPSDGYLLISRGDTAIPSNFAVGTQVNLSTTAIPADFNQYPHILAAGPLMIVNNQIVVDAASEKFNSGFQKQTASRSAIAVDATGKILLIAVHNRIGGKGATLTEMAALLKQLGAKEALNLDGGSSTALSLGGQLIDRSAVTAARVHNSLGVFVSP
ncbi:MAG: phosphodiester glycosidase family protein [Snowella sp.]|nr:phosphodiester glycosidase family protein [Snowella sp.]